MAQQTREQWTRHEVLDYVTDLNADIAKLERFSKNGGKMPARLRKKLQTTVNKLNDTAEAFNDWAITNKEKFEKIVREHSQEN